MRNNRIASALLTLVLVAAAACAKQDDTADGAASTDTASVATPVPAPVATSGFLDPNAATREELVVVPGLETMADSLIAHRPYADMTGVDKILAGARLTEAQRDTIYTRVWLPIDVNKASKAEIGLIPGVGAKMTHEFEEYRPYDAIEKFRREIGKYVDSTEVARLEKYIVIK